MSASTLVDGYVCHHAFLAGDGRNARKLLRAFRLGNVRAALGAFSDHVLPLGAWVVGRVDVLDRPRPQAVKLVDRFALHKNKVFHPRFPVAVRSAGIALAALSSNFSPIPILNVPDMTVTRSVLGCVCGGMR